MRWVTSCWVVLLAGDVGERQNLSIAVPDWHIRSFFAAQAAHEGGHCFLFISHLLQVKLRAISASSIHASFSILPSTKDFKFFTSFLSGSCQTETHRLHTVDLHKGKVKLETSRKQQLGPIRFLFLQLSCVFTFKPHTWSWVLVCLWRNLRNLRGWVSQTRMRSPVPSARWAEGERPRGLLAHELDIQVRETHLNVPFTLTHSPEDIQYREWMTGFYIKNKIKLRLFK